MMEYFFDYFNRMMGETGNQKVFSVQRENINTCLLQKIWNWS